MDQLGERLRRIDEPKAIQEMASPQEIAVNFRQRSFVAHLRPEFPDRLDLKRDDVSCRVGMEQKTAARFINEPFKAKWFVYGPVRTNESDWNVLVLRAYSMVCSRSAFTGAAGNALTGEKIQAAE